MLHILYISHTTYKHTCSGFCCFFIYLLKSRYPYRIYISGLGISMLSYRGRFGKLIQMRLCGFFLRHICFAEPLQKKTDVFTWTVFRIKYNKVFRAEGGGGGSPTKYCWLFSTVFVHEQSHVFTPALLIVKDSAPHTSNSKASLYLDLLTS